MEETFDGFNKIQHSAKFMHIQIRYFKQFYQFVAVITWCNLRLIFDE